MAGTYRLPNGERQPGAKGINLAFAEWTCALAVLLAAGGGNDAHGRMRGNCARSMSLAQDPDHRQHLPGFFVDLVALVADNKPAAQRTLSWPQLRTNVDPRQWTGYVQTLYNEAVTAVRRWRGFASALSADTRRTLIAAGLADDERAAAAAGGGTTSTAACMQRLQRLNDANARIAAAQRSLAVVAEQRRHRKELQWQQAVAHVHTLLLREKLAHAVERLNVTKQEMVDTKHSVEQAARVNVEEVRVQYRRALAEVETLRKEANQGFNER